MLEGAGEIALVSKRSDYWLIALDQNQISRIKCSLAAARVNNVAECFNFVHRGKTN